MSSCSGPDYVSRGLAPLAANIEVRRPLTYMPSTPTTSDPKPFVVSYHGSDRQVVWRCVEYAADEALQVLLREKVAARVRDDAGNRDFEDALQSVASTGFAVGNLRAILEADEPESRDWAIGEALAEVHLAEEQNVIWPWNTERDKRNPMASLAGADLVGLKHDEDGPLFVMGEVKCSSEKAYPPQVMYGRSGMIHQIDTIVNDLSVLGKLLKWLFFRCQRTQHELTFKRAAQRFLESGNRAVALFGVLVRDTEPNAQDLLRRGQSLADSLHAPTTCMLTALHLPWPIESLPVHCTGGSS